MEIYAAVAPMVLTLEGYRLAYGEDDPEELALMQIQDKEQAREIDEVLHDLYLLESSLAEPRDEEGLTEEVGTMADLGTLREMAAALQGHTVDGYQEGAVKAGELFNHLINHAGNSGYYLPVDFPQAFVYGETSIGSAVALLRELEVLQALLAERYPAEVATALAAASPDDDRADLTGPVGVWHSLSRLCRSAIDLDLPVQLS